MDTTKSVEQVLEHHWAFDQLASQTFAYNINDEQSEYLLDVANGLSASAVDLRDENRSQIGEIFTRESEKSLFIFGPCSLEFGRNYSVLFNYIDELKDIFPNVVFAVRLVGAKARTRGDWAGIWSSTDTLERNSIWDTYDIAFNRGIAIVAEVTQGTQLAGLAPWLSAFWLGKRDVTSTSLRTAASAFHLPAGVKNTGSGQPEDVEDTILAISKNTVDNKGSGLDLGSFGHIREHLGLPTGILPIGEGNGRTAIIARGYELPKDLTTKQRRQAAISHLSQMCMLGATLGKAVLIDGSHDVPPMFNVSKKNPDRIIPVLEEIVDAIQKSKISNANQIAGAMAEIGPTQGRTDLNYLLDKRRRQSLTKIIGSMVELLSVAD